MNRAAWASFRIAGLLWALVFGALSAVLFTQDILEKRIQQSLQQEGKSRFVRLNRLQRKRKSLLPNWNTSFPASPTVDYFYTYSYLHAGRTYTVTEQVDVDLYYLHREGENLEAFVYVDELGYPHTRLKGNPPLKDSPLLLYLSTTLASFGGLLATIGFLRRKS